MWKVINIDEYNYSRPALVEANRQVVWPFFFNHIQEGIHEPKNGGGIHPLGVDTRVFYKGVIAPKN